MIIFRICTIALVLCLGVASNSIANSMSKLVDPLQRNAESVPQAVHAVMLAVSSAGSRMVAAGERGIILWSDDGAKTWKQAKVPVSVTITALSFPTPLQGWAVGHGGVILHTADGGLTWMRQLDGRISAELELKAAKTSNNARRLADAQKLVADGPDKPLLAVYFWDTRRGFAIGAYGSIFGTDDGGATWSSWHDRIDNPKGLHLNALYVKNSDVFIAGEQGLVLRSKDDARHFRQIQSPYKGSWFSITGRGDRVVLAGLRGNVFWSDTAGDSWSPSKVPVAETIGATLVTKDGRILFVNQANMVLISTDDGQSLQLTPRLSIPPIAALSQTSDGQLVVATFAGLMFMPFTTTSATSDIGSRR